MNAPPVMNGAETNKAKEDEKVKAVLVLEDGTRYEGYSFGAMSNTSGEIGMIIVLGSIDKWISFNCHNIYGSNQTSTHNYFYIEM